MEQHKHRRDNYRPGKRSDNLHYLLFPRSSADYSPGLEVLHIVACDGGGAANDRADDYRGGRTFFRTFTHEHHQQKRGDENRGDSYSRYGIIGGTDQPGHIAGDGRKNKTCNQHDNGHRQRNCDIIDKVLIDHKQRYNGGDDEHEHPFHGHVFFRSLDFAPALPDGAVCFQPALYAADDGFSHLEDCPEAAYEHGPYADVSCPFRPYHPRVIFCVDAFAQLFLYVRVVFFRFLNLCRRRAAIDGFVFNWKGVPRVRIFNFTFQLVDRPFVLPGYGGDGGIPVCRAAEENEYGDVEPDDVSDRQKRGAQIGAAVKKCPFDASCAFENFRPQADTFCSDLEQSADQGRFRNNPDALAAFLSCFEHLGCCDTLGKFELAFDDERTPQGNCEQDAQQPAERGNYGNPHEVLTAEIVPLTQDYKCRECKYHACRQRFPCRGGSLDDVIFEDITAPKPP